MQDSLVDFEHSWEIVSSSTKKTRHLALFQWELSRRKYKLNKVFKKMTVKKALTKDVTSQFSPTNTVFAFDLHEVVLQPSRLAIMKQVFLTLDGWKFLFVMFIHPLILVSLILRLLGRPSKVLVTEELWYYLVQRQPKLAPLTPFFTKMANDTFSLDKNTASVIKNLKRRGFKVFLISNIGSKFWDEMQRHFKDVFEQLDGFLVASAEDEYLSKPDSRYFQMFVEKFTKEQNYKVVLVDDSLVNIEAACKLDDFYGYWFKNGKTLVNDFAEWNITNIASSTKSCAPHGIPSKCNVPSNSCNLASHFIPGAAFQC